MIEVLVTCRFEWLLMGGSFVVTLMIGMIRSFGVRW